MDEDRQKTIDDLIARNPTVDRLVAKLLTSKEADVLFQEMQDDRKQSEQSD